MSRDALAVSDNDQGRCAQKDCAQPCTDQRFLMRCGHAPWDVLVEARFCPTHANLMSTGNVGALSLKP